MRTRIARLFKRFNRRDVEREVENELRFHLELLTEANLRRGMTLKEAEEAAAKRFGNVERIKNQCIEISERSRPSMRVLKSFLIVVFLGGVLARVFSADIYGEQIGNMLMAIATLGGLLLYLRGLRPFSFAAPTNENSSPLGLSGGEQTPFAAKTQKKSTPPERIIADE
jgi:hypothetical protein